MKKLLAVTACPTGVAHTYMAAEALIKAAADKNIPIKVETRGAVGVENELSPEEIAEAHAIIVAADTGVDEDRFAGKPVVRVGVGEAIRNPTGLIEEALAKEETKTDYVEAVQQAKAERSAKRTGPYKHMMTGVSYMIPIVVAGGLLMAISFIFEFSFPIKSLATNLMSIGSTAMDLMVPVLAGFIAYSIAEKPGIAPGLIGGMLAYNLKAGFLGGLLAGFLAGYIALFLKKYIKLPKSLASLTPIIIIPFVTTLIVGLLMVYIIGGPVSMAMDALTKWLTNMGTANAIILGLIMGGMMAVDMGGPVNKAAYTVGSVLIASQVFGPMAAVMAAGMTPPLGLAIATFIAKKKFDDEEREAGKAAAVLGLSFITEGAIPFAAADPFRVIPSCIVGSAVAGALSMGFGCLLRAPHGGLFVMLIPGTVTNVLQYILSIAVGSLITAGLVIVLKKNKTA